MSLVALLAAAPGSAAIDTMSTDLSAVAQKLVLVAVLAGGVLFLIPPFRALAKKVLGGAAVLWLITSGIGAAFASYFAGLNWGG